MRAFFVKIPFLENNLHEPDDVSSIKKTFLTWIEASLFCVTGINCWAQKFPTLPLSLNSNKVAPNLYSHSTAFDPQSFTPLS